MKKTTTPAKLKLNRETMKTLKVGELTNVVGGVSEQCNAATATATPSGAC